MNLPTLVAADRLRDFTAAAFERRGVPPADAQIAADVLVTADLRGVDSHGVARLHHYLRRIAQGLVDPATRLTVVRELPAALAFDANNGIGLVAAHHAMRECVERAATYGVATVTVRGSNHCGIAGYFAMQALPREMIGVAMTNSSPIVVPFGGRKPLLGTNPLSWAIPCGDEPPLVLDMATSAAAFGKVELAQRTGTPMPLGWALGRDGLPTADPLEARAALSLLPLGGLAEGVGYKGYGLATVVDALCHALAGAAASRAIEGVQTRGGTPSNIGHFFAAYRVDGFRDLQDFKRDMDELVRALHACPPAPGVERVLVPGEKEHLATLHRRQYGIPLHPEVTTTLRAIADELDIPSIT